MAEIKIPIPTNEQSEQILKTNVSDVMCHVISEPTKLNIPTYDGSGQAVHPAVLHIPKGFNGYKFWMAFTPYPNGNDQYENPSIVVSNNGIDWIVPSGLTNPVVPSIGDGTSYNRDPQLIYAESENKLYLYWSRTGVTPPSKRLESTNGITWTNEQDISIDLWGAVRYGSNNWYAYGKNSSDLSQFRGRKSIDGITWTLDKYRIPTNIFGESWHHSIFNDEMGLHCITANYRKSSGLADLSLYYGYSPDGNEFVFDSTPLLQAKQNTFYSQKLYHGCLIKLHDNLYRIYFSSQDVEGKWWTGFTNVKINNPYLKYNQTLLPKPRTAERKILSSEEIRSTSNVLIDIPEFTEYENKVLVVFHNLKNGGNPLNLRIWVTNNIRGEGDIMFYGTTTTNLDIQIPTGDFYPTLVTKDHLKALGYVLPSNSGLRLAASSLPDSGSVTIILKAW